MGPTKYQPNKIYVLLNSLYLHDEMSANYQNRKEDSGVDPAQCQPECLHYLFMYRTECPRNYKIARRTGEMEIYKFRKSTARQIPTSVNPLFYEGLLNATLSSYRKIQCFFIINIKVAYHMCFTRVFRCNVEINPCFTSPTPVRTSN